MTVAQHDSSMLHMLGGGRSGTVHRRTDFQRARQCTGPCRASGERARRDLRNGDRDGLQLLPQQRADLRDRRLAGWQAIHGLISFMVVCCLGAVVNIAIARDVYTETGLWLLASIAGALVNYSLTSVFTWRRRT